MKIECCCLVSARHTYIEKSLVIETFVIAIYHRPPHKLNELTKHEKRLNEIENYICSNYRTNYKPFC